jgi:hypothetical protein
MEAVLQGLSDKSPGPLVFPEHPPERLGSLEEKPRAL